MRPSIAHNTTFGITMCGICGDPIAPQQRHDSCHIEEMEAEILNLTKQLETARAAAIDECIALGIACCKFTAEQRKAMRSADIIYWQHSLCGDTAIMEVVEKCRALLAGITAPSEVDG